MSPSYLTHYGRMRSFSEQLDYDAIQALQELSECRIQTLRSPSSTHSIDHSYVTIPHVSIRIGPKRFLTIGNDWADTPKEYIDYYLMNVDITDRPKGIYVEPYKDCWSYRADNMTLSLGAQQSIKMVSVYEDHYRGEHESVTCDVAILIVLESEKQILIAREESISGLLTMSTNLEDIAKDTAGLEVRWSSRGKSL